MRSFRSGRPASGDAMHSRPVPVSAADIARRIASDAVASIDERCRAAGGPSGCSTACFIVLRHAAVNWLFVQKRTALGIVHNLLSVQRLRIIGGG